MADYLETMYRRRTLTAWLHRRRLERYVTAVRPWVDAPRGRLADVGCANGYVLAALQQALFAGRAWELHGFDHDPEFVERGRARALPHTRFDVLELNHEPLHAPAADFDVVVCFETLEHVGRLPEALRNVGRLVRPGGILILSVPQETGLPGLVKFLGRKVLQRDPYRGFFQRRTEGEYLRALLTGAPLDPFRDREVVGWGPHLGFDLRTFESLLRTELLRDQGFRLLQRDTVNLGMGVFHTLQRAPSAGDR